MDQSDSRMVIFTMTGEVAYWPEFGTDRKEVHYPSTWFNEETNKGKKPPVSVQLSPDSNLQASRAWAYSVCIECKIRTSTIVEYLYHALGKVEMELESDWKSYGRIIPKGKVTPLDLLTITVEQTDSRIIVDNPTTLPESDDLGLIMLIAGLYRYCKTDEKNRSTVIERIDPIINSVVSSGFKARLVSICRQAMHVGTVPEIGVLLSALDMFLERFPQCDRYQRVRVGTKILRHFGFSAYNDLTFMAKLFSSNSRSEVIQWYLTEESRIEIQQIESGNEEFEDQYSYLPYAMGMGLSHKSPYSAASNPNIHFITQVVRCLMNDKMSINTKKPDNILQDWLCARNAAIIYLGVKTGKPLQHYKEFMNYKLSSEDVKLLKPAVSNLKDARQRSIGQWVYSFFSSVH